MALQACDVIYNQTLECINKIESIFEVYDKENHTRYMSYRSYEDQVYLTMDEYQNEVVESIPFHYDCIAEGYVEGCNRSTKLWKSKKLRLAHAYAVLNDYTNFLSEFEENERSEIYE